MRGLSTRAGMWDRALSQQHNDNSTTLMPAPSFLPPLATSIGPKHDAPVSQICAFTVLPSTLMLLVANSTPIVDLDSRLNSLRVKRERTGSVSVCLALRGHV